MNSFIKNNNWALHVCLNLLKVFGFLIPGDYVGLKRFLLHAHGVFSLIFLAGTFVVVLFDDLIHVWGDVEKMTENLCLLMTFLACGARILNVMWRRDAILAVVHDTMTSLKKQNKNGGTTIIKKCNDETARWMQFFILLVILTVLGKAVSVEKGTLPVRARFPYDAYKSPAFEISFFHQCIVMGAGASLNICLDSLYTTLIALCRCRLQLLALSLKNLISSSRSNKKQLSQDEEAVVYGRLQECVSYHQAVLESAKMIQNSFTEPVLVQLTASQVIICVIACQVTAELRKYQLNMIRLVSLISYFLSMTQQIFLYCYQAHQLSYESRETLSAAYECSWYLCSPRMRRALLVLMTRSKRAIEISAGGLVILSLESFTTVRALTIANLLQLYFEFGLMKASYSFFTVIQQMEKV